jgi:hypothetical protein
MTDYHAEDIALARAEHESNPTEMTAALLELVELGHVEVLRDAQGQVQRRDGLLRWNPTLAGFEAYGRPGR